jgi:hypothetical protein
MFEENDECLTGKYLPLNISDLTTEDIKNLQIEASKSASLLVAHTSDGEVVKVYNDMWKICAVICNVFDVEEDAFDLLSGYSEPFRQAFEKAYKAGCVAIIISDPDNRIGNTAIIH